MGQQQLLLLVLSTVIVGLATVAGIQAFSENQQQATQDALVQRAINIGNDVVAAHNEPSQFGGINLEDAGSSGSGSLSKDDVATAAGYSSADPISADGAGDNASCKISSAGGGTATIKCSSDGANDNFSGDGDDYQSVTVTVDPDNTGDKGEVYASSINGS